MKSLACRTAPQSRLCPPDAVPVPWGHKVRNPQSLTVPHNLSARNPQIPGSPSLEAGTAVLVPQLSRGLNLIHSPGLGLCVTWLGGGVQSLDTTPGGPF